MSPSSKRRIIFNTVGALFSVIPPAAATLTYFPLWIDGGRETAFSGICLAVLLICAVPVFRIITRWVATPSAPLIWLFVFVLFATAERIAGEVTVIALVGFISNIIGAIFFYLGRRGEE
jgi:hypothetical protein